MMRKKMTEERYEFTVAPEEEGRRLDAYLAQKLPDYSRSFLQKNIKSKAVLINGKAAKEIGRASCRERV